MHRLATVHARDNQPTNDQRRHDTAYLNKRLFYWSKVSRLIILEESSLTTFLHRPNNYQNRTADQYRIADKGS